MGPQRSAVHQAVADIRAKATELRASFGAESPGYAFEAATRVESAILSEADQILYLPEAGQISRYCERELGRLVRKGDIRETRPEGSHGRVTSLTPGRRWHPWTPFCELAPHGAHVLSENVSTSPQMCNATLTPASPS